MSNQAKDWQKGYYTILVDGKTVAVSKKVRSGKNELGFPTFKTVTATSQCAPEDEFDLTVGVSLAMNRLNKELGKDKIEVGDKVKIVSSGLSYPTYTCWIKKNIDDVGLAACYSFNQFPKKDDTVYIVKVIAPWNAKCGKGWELAYVQRYFESRDSEVNNNEPCYLIDIDGLEKV